MRQTPEAIEQHRAERWCGRAARRDDVRVVRRLYRTPVVEWGYRRDEGALLEDVFHCLQALGVVALRERVEGTAMQREMVPGVQDLWRDGLKSLLGIERMPALPALLCSAAALMRVVGFQTQQVRRGVCQRGAAKQQRPRPEGPISAAALANHMVQLHLRDLEAWFNGTVRALAKAGVVGAKVTGMVDATELETTAADEGCGQVTRQRKITDKYGRMREIEVTIDGWKPIILIEARTKMPLAVPVGRSTRMQYARCERWSRTPGRIWRAVPGGTRGSLIGGFGMGLIGGGSTGLESPSCCPRKITWP